ncbi:MAG: hypothetical protein ACBR50_23895 [Microcoleus sp.]
MQRRSQKLGFFFPAVRSRFSKNTRSPLAKISTNRNLCDRQPTQ